MSGDPRAVASPPLGLIAPFFLVAPLGLVVAGLLLLDARPEQLVAINAPRTVAITHALVLGWVSTTMMGASFQLGPVVLGGALWSERMARIQLALHAGAVAGFVWTLFHWDIAWMGAAGAALYIAFILYILNAGRSLARGREWSLPRLYLAVSLAFLAVAVSLGITWVGTLEHLWFPITFGRLSAHAHLGLVGWIAITLMGVSYQLVPMFNIVNRARPRVGRPALGATALGLALFATVIAFDPPAVVRVPLTLLLAAGPALWIYDQLYLFANRARRRPDIQGYSVIVSLAFLVLAIALGVGAAAGTPLTTDDQPARWLLAYAAAGVLGWAGSALIGNSYKILPFLVWFHRYRPGLDKETTLTSVSAIYSERAARGVLALHATGSLVLVAGALLGDLDVLRLGGALVAMVGGLHLATMLHMFLPKAPRPVAEPGRPLPS